MHLRALLRRGTPSARRLTRARILLKAAEERRLVRTLEFHYTPKHGSWLNIAEIEWSVVSRECLARRIATPAGLAAQIAIYQRRRNDAAQPIEWAFTCDKARLKLHRLYPSAPL